jgi:glucose 1-dehydrogenase
MAEDPHTTLRLQGRRALVTGASSGIGRATAVRLAAEGAAVVVNFVGGPDAADEVVREIAAAGGQAIAVAADVSVEAQVGAMFGRAREAIGPIDLLVNNAGVEAPFALVDMPLEEWQRVIGVNLTGPFLCSREMARALPEGARGVIVNVTSVHEVIPWERFAHYCASKGGLKLFAQTIAKELAPRGIRVVSIGPGAILTPINRQLVQDPRERARVEAEIPLGRLGEPEEIAAAIAWLAGDEAAYVTGATLFVDGGMTLYPGFV